MLASSRKPCPAANPKRRARSPALQSPCKRAVTQKAAALCQTRPQADAIIGPYAEGRRSIIVIHPPCLPSRLCRPFALHCRAGVHARRGACGGTDLAGQCKRRPLQRGVSCKHPPSARPDRGPMQSLAPVQGCAPGRTPHPRKGLPSRRDMHKTGCRISMPHTAPQEGRNHCLTVTLQPTSAAGARR